MKTHGFISNVHTVGHIIARNIMLFCKDKATVFFSMLAPLIILMLYVLFLAQMQIDTVKSSFEAAGLAVADNAIKAFMDSWLISGMVSVSCITVALNSMTVLVSDRQNKVVQDFIASPIKPVFRTLANFLSFFIITFIMTLVVMAIGMGYMAISSGFFMTFAQVANAIGLLALSCLSSVMILMVIVSFFKSTSALGAFSGIISAMIGFVIGAYMPISSFSKGVQFVANILPASHSSALFRGLFMEGALVNIGAGLPPEAFNILAETLRNTYSFNLYLFDFKLENYMMYIYVALSVVVFFMVNWLLFRKKKI